ncbi:MAG TPA: tetraacyldisaccharide 4'-kinase [Lutibacter sp.]|nr:tetraacyldisaccharide 4'-kinase [Lutibacter sp.]
MSSKLRKLLYPLSVLYEGITHVRNKLYDKEILKSNEFGIPTILVGNLRVGGTGKTPQVIYLINLLKDAYKVAVLSRGYKRKTTGFILASNTSTSKDIGDEPYQFYKKFPKLLVAVDEDRTHGINKLQELSNPPDVIILDDAFQHRKIQAGFSILITAYDDLYINDSHLPSGNLRENIKGANRADVIIVSKCPDNLTEEEEYQTAVKLQPTLKQIIFFTKIIYADFIQNSNDKISLSDLVDYTILLVTGIANPKPLVKFLESKKINFEHISFPDHHNLKTSEINRINKKLDTIENKNKLILSTEKDYVRIFDSLENLYFLVIETTFINHQKDFDKLIIDYVGENTRDR